MLGSTIFLLHWPQERCDCFKYFWMLLRCQVKQRDNPFFLSKKAECDTSRMWFTPLAFIYYSCCLLVKASLSLRGYCLIGRSQPRMRCLRRAKPRGTPRWRLSQVAESQEKRRTVMTRLCFGCHGDNDNDPYHVKGVGCHYLKRISTHFCSEAPFRRSRLLCEYSKSSSR